MQGFLQVDDDLALVLKYQCDHAPDALVIDVGIALVVDAVTTGLHRTQHTLSAIQVFDVGHYNSVMLKTKQILVRPLLIAIGVLSLGACGQPGALYLPTEPAAAQRATLTQTLTPANPFEAAPKPPMAPPAPKPVTPSAPIPSSQSNAQ